MRLVSGYYEDNGFPFNHLKAAESIICTQDENDLKKGDILIIWGGQDISPSLYGKPVSRYTGADVEPSHRDQVEWALMRQAAKLNLPIVGVCRGAQMLCALAGGTLLQHVTSHGGSHIVTTPTGYEFTTNSIHHQMMYPWDVKHEMLASIKRPLSKVHFDVNDPVDIKEEPEFVYFPEVRGFAVQWHPEVMESASEATQYVLKEIESRL